MEEEVGYLLLKNYFENLVSRSNFLHGFAGFFARELFNKLGSKKEPMQAPYLALFRYNLDLTGQELSTQAIRKMGFSIISHNVKPDNYEDQYRAIDLAEKLALKVLARMFYENKIKDHFLWNSIIKESIKIVPLDMEKIGFGVEVYFNLKNKQTMILDPADWNDITSVC